MAITNTSNEFGPVQVASPAFGNLYISTVEFDIEAPLTPEENISQFIGVASAANFGGSPNVRGEIVAICDSGNAALDDGAGNGLQMVLDPSMPGGAGQLVFRTGATGAVGATPAAAANLRLTVIVRV